jgi:hypothetical protein
MVIPLKGEKKRAEEASFLFRFVHAQEDAPQTVLARRKAKPTRDELNVE